MTRMERLVVGGELPYFCSSTGEWDCKPRDHDLEKAHSQKSKYRQSRYA